MIYMNNQVQDLTLLSEGQIWGNSSEPQLEVMKKYGPAAAITDLCILTGCLFDQDNYFHINEDKSLAGRTGSYWTKSSAGFDYEVVTSFYGRRLPSSVGCRLEVIRPVLRSPEIFSQISSKRVKGYNGTEEVEYGEYPQMAADSRMQNILESKYYSGELKKTGGIYTFDSTQYDNYDIKFEPVTHEEYEYQGKKYIHKCASTRFGHDCDGDDEMIMLSNGVKYEIFDDVWVEVSPVKWLIDDETETLIAKYGLVSGIKFLDEDTVYRGDFSKTELKMYLDKYMVHDLFQNIALIQTQTAINFEDKEQLDKLFLYETESNTKGKIKQLRFRAK